MFSQLPKATIFAHRGASVYAPENTLAAFEAAVQQHADAIELDAKLTADRQVVVIHDQTVDRTTNGSGEVRKMSLEAIRELDAGSFFDVQFKGEKIPLLSEVFEAVGKRIFINIELTNYASLIDELPFLVVALVKQFNLHARVMFSSFNPIALWRVKHQLPEVPVGLLAQPGKSGAWARSWLSGLLRHEALHPEKRDANPSLVQKVHRSGRRVYVYTVNQPQEMQQLFQIGVDGIFTDDPLLAQQARKTD